MCSRIQWNAKGQPVLVGRNMDWTAHPWAVCHWVFILNLAHYKYNDLNRYDTIFSKYSCFRL